MIGQPPMTSESNKNLLEVMLKEYEKLKDEQTQRIGFRDNMLYVGLVVIGGIVSFAMSDAEKNGALLLVPWVCLILGWTYLVNDEKISSIGRYVRTKLDQRISQAIELPDLTLFGWEVEHRSDKYRTQRKLVQLLVDETAFCLSGIGSVCFYLVINKPPFSVILICSIEVILLLGMGVEFWRYADLKKGRS